mmetsp:Transcript_11900/g.17898  ORF Transcript_11900/g.17898 Transcript_11900/m.17898 type:complete len:949 (+) Transcript_11900:121-2967(+)|eukprot:CAMPEP_0196812328 /NCGR_PEP_ID=MMETSP1362-20130617/24465_1 /TAXON_ID=163516 /ORGANISM="Leptocylindrus danicus, Strain CCMP1856" /LENGTH=948 /DNA_ID=CAMNT_0042187907 /DNA_START=105 /DNA_END=2951 /DNA_ORIENTATION=-
MNKGGTEKLPMTLRGTPAFMQMKEERDLEECCRNCDSTTNVSTIRIAAWKQLAEKLEEIATGLQADLAKEGTEVQYQIVQLNTIEDLMNEVLLDTKLKTRLYDGFIVPATITGGLFEEEGLLNLTDLIDSGDDPLKKDDIFPFYQTLMRFGSEKYDTKYMVPIMGDLIMLIYNKDLFGDIQVPRTWGEYKVAINDLAEAHKDKDIIPSCTTLQYQPRCDYCSLTTNVHAVLSTMTQGTGSKSETGGGIFFVKEDEDQTAATLDPIFDSPFYKTIEILEFMNSGSGDVALQDDPAEIKSNLFNEGKCGMMLASSEGIDFNNPSFGVDHMPGSELIYNPANKVVETCTLNTCMGDSVEINNQGRLVNRVRFLGHQNFFGGVSRLVESSKQKPTFEFLARVSRVANFAPSNPIRRSQADFLTNADLKSVIENEEFQEVIPMRIPQATDLLEKLGSQTFDFLGTAEASESEREALGYNLENVYEKQIEQHDGARAAVPLSIFQQKSQGTFQPNESSDNSIPNGLRYSGWALSGIAIICSLYFALWTFKNRNVRVVRASQPSFLIMVCVGVFIMSTSIIPMGFDDVIASQEGNDIACAVQPWLYSVGFVIAFSALFSKTWRINKIFHNPDKFKRVKVTAKDVLMPFVCLMSANLVVLSMWTYFNPLQWTRKVKGEVDMLGLSTPETYGLCTGEDYTLTILFSGLLAAVNITIVLFANVQAYQCRNISMEYSESQWIAIAMVSIIQVWFIGIPLMILVVEDPPAQFVVRTAIVFVTSMSTVLLMFLPKVKYLRDYKQKRAMEEAKRQERSRLAETMTDYSHYASNAASNISVNNSTAEEAEMPQDGTGRSGRQGPKRPSYGLEGIKILGHPGEEDAQVKIIKAQILAAEDEHKALRKRLEELRENIQGVASSDNKLSGRNSDWAENKSNGNAGDDSNGTGQPSDVHVNDDNLMT